MSGDERDRDKRSVPEVKGMGAIQVTASPREASSLEADVR